jgi:hypothetical protein
MVAFISMHMPLVLIQSPLSEYSADHFVRFSRWAVLMLVLWLVIAPDGLASPARGISTSLTNPIVPMTPDGGVLMVPLTADRPGENWPRTMPVTLEDGRRITGHVAWIAPTSRRHGERWTDSPLGLIVRGIQPSDSTAGRSQGNAANAGQAALRSVGTPFLLAELPPDTRGTIRVLHQTLHPQWMATAANGEKDSNEPSDVLQRERALDRPDPEHPLEYWRWVLLADRLGKLAPPPPSRDDDVTVRLTALHTAQLWQVALSRVREHSWGVADHLRDLLTRICVDDDHGVNFAAWVADPVAINALLNLLVDDDLVGDRLVQRSLEWADAHEGLMVWLESTTDRHLHLAIVNPSFRPKVARLRWGSPDEVSVAVELNAGHLTRVRIDRRAPHTERSSVRPGQVNHRSIPPAADALDDAPEPELLRIEAEDSTYALVLDVPIQQVMPPGVYLPPLSPTLTLAAIQQGQPLTAPEQYATAAHIRRLRGRWEVFVECRRPLNDTEAAVPAEPHAPASALGSLQNVAHRREHVALFIGEDDSGSRSEHHPRRAGTR